MRYLLILTLSSFGLKGFSQKLSTVTLVFVTPSNNNVKNYEAVVDDVSYYSDNSSEQRNTIWLNNFQPGQHSIKVYPLKNASHEERTGNSPVYASTFTIRDGYDTKIAVKTDGQVQISERLSSGQAATEDKESVVKSPVKHNARHSKLIHKPTNPGTIKTYDETNNSVTSTTKDQVDEHEDDYNKTRTTVRHSRKRFDTAVIVDGSTITDDTEPGNTDEKIDETKTGSPSSERFDNKDNQESAGVPMDDKAFSDLYEKLRNEWLPGQKMKTLTNEFLNTDDKFSTAQAKQLILLVTDELNRIKLAKSSYHNITDPENFSEINDVFRHPESKEQLDDFIGKN